MFLESELPYDWELLSKKESAAMEVELLRETCTAHPLHCKKTNAIARNRGCDEFLFTLKKGADYLIVANLTWKYEADPRFPELKVFNDKDSFLKEYED